MKAKIKYTDEPIGHLNVIKDCLPPPEDIVLRGGVTKSSMDPRRVRELPKAECDILLEQAVSRVEQDYREGGNLHGFEALSEQDHYDISLPED